MTDLSASASIEPYRAPMTITKISAFSRTFRRLFSTVVWSGSIGNESCSDITARQPSPSTNWRSCARSSLRSYMVELTKTFGGRFFIGRVPSSCVWGSWGIVGVDAWGEQS